jgi:hypothetical protein
LRARGILPPKDEKSEEEINDLIDEVIAERVAKNNSLDDKTLDELDELEDDVDDRILLEYRYVDTLRISALCGRWYLDH